MKNALGELKQKKEEAIEEFGDSCVELICHIYNSGLSRRKRNRLLKLVKRNSRAVENLTKAMSAWESLENYAKYVKSKGGECYERNHDC